MKRKNVGLFDNAKELDVPSRVVKQRDLTKFVQYY